MKPEDKDTVIGKDGLAHWAKIRKPSTSPMVRCPVCNKKIRYQGINGHMRFVHKQTELPEKESVIVDADPFELFSELADKLIALFDGDKKKAIKKLKDYDTD